MREAINLDFLSKEEFADLCRRYEEQLVVGKRVYSAYKLSYDVFKEKHLQASEYGTIDLIRYEDGRVNVSFERHISVVSVVISFLMLCAFTYYSWGWSIAHLVIIPSLSLLLTSTVIYFRRRSFRNKVNTPIEEIFAARKLKAAH